MKHTLLTIFLLACCSVANAQWEHLADLRTPQLLPVYFPLNFTGPCAGPFVSGYNYEVPKKVFLSTDQGQSFKPFPFAGLPSPPQSIFDEWLYSFPDQLLTFKGYNSNQLYRLLPNSEIWEPLGSPINDTTFTASDFFFFRLEARQGTNFIASGYKSVLDTTTGEWAEIYKEYRSYDEGNTWMPNETGLPGFGFSWSTPLDSVVLAQNGPRDSTYFSTDGGVNWQAVTYPPGLCHALNIRNRSGSNLLAQDTCQKLFFSADGGKSWFLPSGLDSVPFFNWAESGFEGLQPEFFGELLQSGGSLILHPSSYYIPNFDSLYRSNDQGLTWTSIPFKLYDSFKTGSDGANLIATPNGTLLTFIQPELYASTDAGDTWIKVLDAPEVELEPIDYLANLFIADSVVYLMGDGGFFVSTDQGLTWTDRTQNTPLRIEQVRGLSANGPVLIAKKRGFACNTYVSADSGATWKKSPVCNLQFARYTPQGIFACTGFTNILYEGAGPFTLFKSTDDGATWKGVPLEREGPLDFLQPAGDKLIVMGPAIQVADPTRLMVSDLQGENWSLSSNGVAPGTELHCAAYDSITGKIYTASRYPNPDLPGDIYVSSDQGQTWEVSAPGLRGASMVAYNGNVCVMAEDKVHVSHDSGVTWKTIADSVLVGNGDAENALVLADGNLIMGGNSVFISQDWGETWAPFNEGLPPGELNLALDLVRDDQYLYTASYGRGIYRRPISDLTSSTRPEAALARALEVYPNPSASGVFQVKADWAGQQPLQLFVMDAGGKTIWHGVLSGGRQSINLSAAPPGVYWLRAVSDKETVVRKLVKAGG